MSLGSPFKPFIPFPLAGRLWAGKKNFDRWKRPGFFHRGKKEALKGIDKK
jgi:hypothetical protein